jgi:hypothetical protein
MVCFSYKLRKHHTRNFCSLRNTSYLKFIDDVYRNQRYIYTSIQQPEVIVSSDRFFSPIFPLGNKFCLDKYTLKLKIIILNV